jgi:hypothetical protein
MTPLARRASAVTLAAILPSVPSPAWSEAPDDQSGLVPVSTTLDRFTLKPTPQEPLVLEFTQGGLVINPGPWAQRGERVP